MTSGYKSYRATRFLGGISQYILAALFLFSGFVKAVDPVGTALKVSDYFTAFGLSALRGLSLSCCWAYCGRVFAWCFAPYGSISTLYSLGGSRPDECHDSAYILYLSF